MSKRRKPGALIVLTMSLLALGVACGTSSLGPAGTACSSDGDCAAGLSCLGLGMFSDAGCMSVAKACSKTCSVDGDCVSVGPKFKCFANCGGMNTCGQTP